MRAFHSRPRDTGPRTGSPPNCLALGPLTASVGCYGTDATLGDRLRVETSHPESCVCMRRDLGLWLLLMGDDELAAAQAALAALSTRCEHLSEVNDMCVLFFLFS